MAEKDYIQEEPTQVCKGVLLEDMVDTIARTKKMYCDVWIKGWFTKDSSHPLTYVPLWALSLPLKAEQEVLVRFKDGDINLPYLWKDPEEIDEGFYKPFEFEKEGDLPEKPEPTVSAQKLGEDSFIIKTDSYTVIRQNGGFVLMDNEDNVFVKGKKVQLIGEKFSVVNSSQTSLYQILYQTLTILNSSLTTAGSPANHTVVPEQFQTQLQQLQELME